jgi:hypothetical protein
LRRRRTGGRGQEEAADGGEGGKITWNEGRGVVMGGDKMSSRHWEEAGEGGRVRERRQEAGY